MAAPVTTASAPFVVLPQWNASQAGVPVTLPSPAIAQKPAFYQVFLKGQPKALGTAQIIMALSNVALGVVLIAVMNAVDSIGIISGICFWGPVFYIISGSLSVAAANKQSRCLVRGSLAMNIISSVVSFTAFVIFCIDIPYFAYFYYCNSQYYYQCEYLKDTIQSIKWIALSFLIISALLQFSISVSLSAFGCRSLSNTTANPPQVIVIPNEYTTQQVISTTPAYGNQNGYIVIQGNVAQGGAFDFRNAQLQVPGNPQPDYKAGNITSPSIYPNVNTHQQPS